MSASDQDPHADAPVSHVGAPVTSARAVVILAHGRNAAPPNVLELAGRLDLPDVAYLAPAANGRTWYPLSFLAPRQQNEPSLTSALARLHAAGALAGPNGLGESTRFLGAFRADGLLVPVWDLDPGLEADAYEDGLAALATRYEQALAATEPLTAQERRARAGLLSRQLTLR